MTIQSNFTGKRLFILRHALALSNAPNGDETRALSPKGIENSKALGRVMEKHGYTPDITLCSPATRTKQTLEALQYTLETPNVSHPKILYDGTTGDYLYEIQQVSDEHQNILFIAHNPSVYELIILLAAQGKDTIMQRLSQDYKPATLSVINCECQSWKDIHPAVNELADLLDPMDYNAPARPTRWM